MTEQEKILEQLFKQFLEEPPCIGLKDYTCPHCDKETKICHFYNTHSEKEGAIECQKVFFNKFIH